MNSFPPPDVSLYELAVNSEQPPHPLQLSPTTFKSIVGLFFDFLVDQNLPATIWLKLPRGEVWQSELDRFCQLTTSQYTIYSLQTYQKTPDSLSSSSVPADSPSSPAIRPSSAKAVTKLGSSGSRTPHQGSIQESTQNPSRGIDGADIQDQIFEDLVLDDSFDLPTTTLDSSRIRNLPLASESQLKREYFLLVASPSFYGLVLAHRPRSMRGGIAEGVGTRIYPGTHSGTHPGTEDSLDRKHPLLGICSFDQAMIQQVLEEGINAAICMGQSDLDSSDNLQELLISWDDLKHQHAVTTLDPIMVGKLLTKQIQRQEELWRSGAAQRRQAEVLPTLQQENEQLLEALRAKDEFIKTMGLELRTPLSTMKTALSLLNSPSLKPPQRQRYMDMLSQECDRQSSLVAGVLDLVQLESEVEQTSMEAIRLSDVVPGVVSTYQPLAQEKGVMLAYVVPEDLPSVSCSTPWLKQIVINLLHNSIKFTPKGGQVWVRARQQGESIQIEFRDSGVGIAVSDIPRIFDRFYRVRNIAIDDSIGVGLGLAIVQQLLLRCGGSISVKSKQGEGSVFSVMLPVFEPT